MRMVQLMIGYLKIKAMKFFNFLVLILIINTYPIFSQNILLTKYEITNQLFKNNIISILNLEKKHMNQNKYLNLDYDIHYVSIEKKKEDIHYITIERVKYDYILDDLYSSKQLGYFYLRGNYFVVNEPIINLFKKLSHTQSIELPEKKDNDGKLPLFDGGLPEWTFILSNGYLFLESGYIE